MSWIEPPADFDPWSLAEFIEAELLFTSDDYLSLTEIRVLFASGLQPTEEELAFAFMEIERRSQNWGEHYPFLSDGRGVLIERNSSTLYAFLLLMSLKGMPVRQSAAEIQRSDPLFDAVVREAFASHLGGQSVVFAWPSRGDRPKEFPDAVEWVAGKMGLELRNKGAVPTEPHDAGVDVIAWKAFTDKRTGFNTFLVQNTVQWEFRKKPRDVIPTMWFEWITWTALPSVGFAIPFAMPLGDPWWKYVTSETTIVMDRGRLLEALDGVEPTGWAEWQRFNDFVSAQLEAARIRGDAAPAVPRPRGRRKKS
ncbi:hypothetical protein [Promicromonospora sp. NPDC019610]|uniref:hypothetical protein n=1 Tax=Promicromonospora sp. NPDC019610 TaxID=3364405 RepID=UPI0037AEC841